ncbi:MAG: pitrilysin family protein [Minisyncoccia bacterium]
MSKKSEIPTKISTSLLKKVKSINGITEFTLTCNDLKVIYVHRPGSGVVTSDIVYFVGSRDEARGETGIAHMLEHMLFKPTHADLRRKTDSGAMHFERETGVILNANTWKDRTSYYFSYPVVHFDRALQIEAERMHGVVLSDKEFKPEQTNVLSEFDMYAGDEHFSLSVGMAGAAFESHTYGHETIGFRDDISSYTTEKLNAFYTKYYAPNNAALIIVGDVSETDMKTTVVKHFAKLKKSTTLTAPLLLTEPKQEGPRTVVIKRPSTTQVYALGVKHDAFPSQSWFETMAIFDMLAGGTDSVLGKALIDTGRAVSMQTSLEPTREGNLGVIFITLTKKSTHAEMHSHVQKLLRSLTPETIAPYLKKTIAKALTSEFETRENSLGYTSELVEYVSAHAWDKFFDSEKILKSITPALVKKRLDILFYEDNTTIGHFIGTK